MKRQYDITINGEYVLCNLHFVQAYWIAFALFIAGYYKGCQRVRVQSRLVSSVPELWIVYVNSCRLNGITLTKWKASILVCILHLFGYKKAEKIPF